MKTKEELITIGTKIVNAIGTESEIDKLIEEFNQNVLHPSGANLFFYPENYNAKKDNLANYNPTVEEVVNQCLRFKPTLLP